MFANGEKACAARRSYVLPPDFQPSFVWQHHDLFHRWGLDAAHRLGVPSVLFVDAPQVWEAKKWGVNRPIWGPWLERLMESPTLSDASLVACVSEDVRDAVARAGSVT